MRLVEKFCFIALVSLMATVAPAQTGPAVTGPDTSLQGQVKELQRAVAAQQEEIRDQQRQISGQRQEIESLRQKLLAQAQPASTAGGNESASLVNASLTGTRPVTPVA